MSTPRASSDNPYRGAIDDTVRLLQRRARAYRDLVVAISLLGFAVLGWTAWGQSGRPFALVALLAPLCLGFLWHDRRLLNGWRTRLLADWTAGGVDFAALRGALLANPTLPRTTIAAMLDSLPNGGDPRHERAISLPARKAVALTVMNSDREHAAGLALASLAATLGAIGSVFAVLLLAWWPLLCLLLAIPIGASSLCITHSRLL